MTATWVLSSSSDPVALAVVDGTGRFAAHGPHYSRRTPGSRTFTGVGAEVVLVTSDGCAVWAVVYQKTPTAVGSGRSRGRGGQTDQAAKYFWRNMLFRNLGPDLSSELIASALQMTYAVWAEKYGRLPAVPLRTEVDIGAIRSTNPGYCYKVAGWTPVKRTRGKIYLIAPPPEPLGNRPVRPV
jgi:hypothetical protein